MSLFLGGKSKYLRKNFGLMYVIISELMKIFEKSQNLWWHKFLGGKGKFLGKVQITNVYHKFWEKNKYVWETTLE